jgi:hypothetical protein
MTEEYGLCPMDSCHEACIFFDLEKGCCDEDCYADAMAAQQLQAMKLAEEREQRLLELSRA